MYVCGTNTAVLRIKLASLPSADKKKTPKKPKQTNTKQNPPKKETKET